jgi:hypothetical protein
MRAWGHGICMGMVAWGHGVCRGIVRICTTHRFISYIISFCIASNFHKFDQINKVVFLNCDY